MLIKTLQIAHGAQFEYAMDDRDLPDTEELHANGVGHNFGEDDDGDDDYDEEPITSKKLVENLQTAWTNEKFAPDLLPHQSDIVALMLDQIVHMEQNLAALARNDFRLIAHRMELARIRYLISSYLRTRLAKIERFCAHLLAHDNGAAELMSAEERQFAESFAQAQRAHFRQCALRHMPLNLQEPSAAEVVRPNCREHVFLKANVSVSSVVVGRDDEEVDLVAGSRHIMPYNLAAELVRDGRVQLI